MQKKRWIWNCLMLCGLGILLSIGTEKSSVYAQEMTKIESVQADEAETAESMDEMLCASGTTVKPQAVKNLKAQVVNWNQVKLTWTTSGAEGYLVYRKTTGQDKFSYCAIAKSGSYIDKNAAKGVYSYYRIYPYNTDKSGKRVVGASTAYVYARPKDGPAPVTGLKASLQYSDIVKLQWNASHGADGYLVYRKTGMESNFSYRYMVTGTSFTDTSASQLEYNYYRIYPFYKDASGKRHVGGSTAYVYAKPLGIPEVTGLKTYIDRTDGNVQIVWNLNYDKYYGGNIEGFLVYRKIGNAGKFEFRANMNIQNMYGYVFEDSTASMTEQNFYKVYAYYTGADGKKKIGPCDGYTYGKASIPAVYELAAYEQIDQVRVRWDKNTDVEGYDVYRKQGDGAFQYLASTNSLEYIDNSASKDQNNFYRVYPYRTVNGQHVTGLSDSYVYGKAKDYSLGQAIADYGWQFIGTPYVWGGNDLTTGVDCSGFTTQVYAHFGISLPRTSANQAKSGMDLGTDLANAQPGDIITFCYDPSEDACHTSIYLGKGKIIHSSTTNKWDGTVVDGIQIGNANYMQIKSIRRYY